MRLFIACTVVLSTLLLPPPSAQATSIPWGYLPKARGLSAGQKAEVKKVIESFPSYYGCKTSIASCLGQKAQ
ncbi:MAG: hypothetical protein JRH20_19030, partial [Deltaproteobacteria bacterium]|nr:hypothetical protein [Deltaproteobacteria bacterium]